MILITSSTGYMSSQTHKRFEKLKIKYIGVDCLKYCISNKLKITSII